MKFFIFVHLFFIQFSFADEIEFPSKIEITIPDYLSDEKISCTFDPKVTLYICPNGKKPLLVKMTSSGIVAFGNDNQNQPSIYKVNKVFSGKKIIFDSADISPATIDQEKPLRQSEFKGNSPTPEDFPDFRSYYASRVAPVEIFFELEGDNSNRTKGSKAYEEIFSRALRDYELEKIRLNERYSKSIGDSEFQVLFEDGKKRICKRDSTKKLSDKEIQLEKKSSRKIQCGPFNCGDMTIGRKEYNVVMLYDSHPSLNDTGSIHLLDANGQPGPTLHIKKIISKNIPIPLVENSIDAIIDAKLNANNFPKNFGDDQGRLAIYKDPTFDANFKSFQNSCLPDNPILSKISTLKSKLVDQLADTKLVEFIQLLADGKFLSTYIDPNTVLENACYYRGVLLDRTALEKIDLIKKNFRPDENIESTITPERATQLFKKALAMKDIAWNYKKDGCYARAHLMARSFEAEGVRVDKVWINGNLSVKEFNSSAEWNYHVAPIVYVKNPNGLIQKMVIDPSLFDRPVSVDEWDLKISKATKKQKSDLTVFPFPSNAELMERSSLSFSSSDPYMPEEDALLSEDKKMEMAKKTMKAYIGLGKR